MCTGGVRGHAQWVRWRAAGEHGKRRTRGSGPHQAVELVAGVVEAGGEVLPLVELFARALR